MFYFCDGSFSCDKNLVGAGIVSFDGNQKISTYDFSEPMSYKEFRTCNAHELYAVYQVFQLAWENNDQTITIVNDSNELNIKYYLEHSQKYGKFKFINPVKVSSPIIQKLRILYQKMIETGFTIHLEPFQESLEHRLFMVVTHKLSRTYQECVIPEDVLFIHCSTLLFETLWSNDSTPIHIHRFILDIFHEKAKTSRTARGKMRKIERFIEQQRIILSA